MYPEFYHSFTENLEITFYMRDVSSTDQSIALCKEVLERDTLLDICRTSSKVWIRENVVSYRGSNRAPVHKRLVPAAKIWATRVI